MIENYRREGKPTYKRDLIMWAWDIEILKRSNSVMVAEFGERYYKKMPVSDVKYSQIDFSIFGPIESFSIIVKKYVIEVRCRTDGWYILLATKMWGDTISPKIKEMVFGNFNINYIWTMETESVVDIMGELYYEILYLYEED